MLKFSKTIFKSTFLLSKAIALLAFEKVLYWI
jgi:hypothetical protein